MSCRRLIWATFFEIASKMRSQMFVPQGGLPKSSLARRRSGSVDGHKLHGSQKRRFWKAEQQVVACLFERCFVAQIECSHPPKSPRKETPELLFRFPKYSFGWPRVGRSDSFWKHFSLVFQRYPSNSLSTFQTLRLGAIKFGRLSHYGSFVRRR